MCRLWVYTLWWLLCVLAVPFFEAGQLERSKKLTRFADHKYMIESKILSAIAELAACSADNDLPK
jgi:hypothetical protein